MGPRKKQESHWSAQNPHRRLIAVDVDISNEQKDLPIRLDNIQAIVSEVLKLEDQRAHLVGIHFVDTSRICQLHQEFFADPSPTDCISFPLDGPEETHYRVLGEVFICPKTAIEYAEKHGLDPYVECTLYLVHGMLHLMGYDDINEKDRKKMRAVERRHMAHLQSLNLKVEG